MPPQHVFCRLILFLLALHMYAFYIVSQHNLCVQFLSSDAQSSGAQRKPSFNGELNGLLGAAGLLGSADRSIMSDSTAPISTDLCSTQESQIM